MYARYTHSLRVRILYSDVIVIQSHRAAEVVKTQIQYVLECSLMMFQPKFPIIVN